MPTTNLPTDLLRTFITIIELGGFTRAAEMLGRSQPAISLQMKRLEALLDSKLIVQTGRDLTLTDDGRAMAVIARQILRLNDMAVSQFERRNPDEIVRVGLPVDYAVSAMQAKMTAFIQAHPTLQLEVQCELSSVLMDMLHGDQIDIVLAHFAAPDQQYLFRSWRERPIWVASKTWQPKDDAPIHLIAHPEVCEYRNRMVAALTRKRRSWRVVFSSPGVQAVQQAVVDGLGISLLTRPTLLPGMRVLTPEDGFEVLDDINIGLFYKHARLHEAGHKVVGFLEEAMDSASGTTAVVQEMMPLA